MKKVFTYVFMIYVLATSLYALDFSLGFTVGGWGPTINRGSDYKARYKDLGENFKAPFVNNMSFSPVLDIKAKLDIIPYFGIELGVGYAMRGWGYEGIFEVAHSLVPSYKYSTNVVRKVIFHQLSIPLLFIGQYEIEEMFNVYGGLGPKINFNMSAGEGFSLIIAELEGAEQSFFSLDVSLVAGAEYNIDYMNYVGLRLGYDLNVLGNYKTEGYKKHYTDAFSVSFTYRHKFYFDGYEEEGDYDYDYEDDDFYEDDSYYEEDDDSYYY